MMSTAVRERVPTSGPRHRRGRLRLLAGVAVVLLAAGAVTGAVLQSGRSGTHAGPGLSGAQVRRAVATRTGVFRGTDAAQVDAYSAWLGRPVDVVVDFSSRDTWQEIADPAYLLKEWQGTDYRPVLSVALLPTLDRTATVAQGATGAYDHYFQELGQALVAAGQPDAVLRLGWEFNLATSRWATDRPAEFVDYWRQVVSTMRTVPGERFEFDWNPNNGDNVYDASDYYPGDDVVDYVGVDAYDVGYVPDSYPYPTVCTAKCRAQRQHVAWTQGIYGGARGLRYWSRFADHHGKPMSLPEWGLWTRADGHGGGENLYYLDRMHAFITDPANDVAYQSYFEYDGPDGEHRLMTDFPAAGNAFRELFAGA